MCSSVVWVVGSTGMSAIALLYRKIPICPPNVFTVSFPLFKRYLVPSDWFPVEII